MRRPAVLLALVIVALLGALAVKALLTSPPPVRSQSASGEFNAARAKARLANVLGDERPHPTDSAANDAVRDRILAQLSGMGLQPVVRDQFACNGLYKQRGVSCARVRNVIAVLGPSTSKAVLLNAHYDSTPTGPGAGDDGIGVATLLEVAEILKSRQVKRPVILLFNEGEELGLVGARAFLADPLSRNVDSLVNLEARGVQGPVNMFETSRPNAAAVRVFASAVERPVANSLSTDVYRLMPNYTDVNSFAERGWLTLNLAPVGNETRYHSAGDNVAALSGATLQHMGDQTLALAQQLAGAPAPAAPENRIFMDVAGRGFISLPLSVGIVLLAGLLIAFAVVSVRRGALGRGAALAIGTIVGAGLLAWLMLALLGLLRHGMFWRANSQWTTFATYSGAILVAALLLATVSRRATVRQLRPVVWLVYLALGAIIGILAPGGIVFFLFPPLVLLVGILVSRYWRPAEAIASAAAIILLYLTWGAMLGLLEELLNSGPMWIFAPLGSLLILPVMVEAKPLIDTLRLKWSALLCGTLVLAGWIAAAAAPAYSADRQQRFVIEHVTDAGSGKAYWSVLNNGVPLPDGFKSAAKWRREELPYSTTRRWLADAPAAGMRAPAIERMEEVRNGSERVITLRLRANGAERIALVAPSDARIRSAGTAGFIQSIDPAAADGDYSITCSGRSCDGAVLQIASIGTKPTGITVVGLRNGLPPSARGLIEARPRHARPQYAPDQMAAFQKVRL